jgi:serpin B
MRKIIRVALRGAFLISALAAIALTQAHFATPAAAQPTASRIEAAQADLGLRLLVALAKDDQTRNVQASPASVAAVFSYLDLGAGPVMKGAIAKMLGFRPEEGEEAISSFRRSAKTLIGAPQEKGPLAFAYAMFVRSANTLKPGGSDLLSREGMSTSLADLRTEEGVAIVNKWIADHTADLIPHLIREPMPDAVAAAINALYFKDKWAERFDAQHTMRRPFHLVDGKMTDVDMMSLRTEFATREDGRFVAVKLPYVTPGFSLVVVTTGDEPAPRAAFAGVADWLVGADFQKRKVELFFPKFKVDTNFDIFPILAEAGLREGLQSADPFPLLFNPHDLITKVIQGCVIKVDEEGTEAAAATAAIARHSAPERIIRIVVDKPFVYALRDEKRGMILLTGYVANPSAQ